MYLEPVTLHSFLVLAEELHFRKAAERLFVSQPALSKQIRRLEEQVGGPLFARTRRKVGLTEAGRVLLPLAEKVLHDSEAALEQAKEAAAGRAGTLRIGFGIAAISEILPRALLLFQRSYAQVELHMRDMSTPSQIASLLDGKIDIGLARLPIAHPEIRSFPLFRERLVAVTPRSIRYKAAEGLASLRNQPFIFLQRSISETFHDHALAMCRRAGFAPRIVQEATELYTILNLVRAGLGVSLVASSVKRMSVPGVYFHELNMPEAEWEIGVAWNKSTEKRVLISKFAEIIKKITAEV
jgi:DNA-binding transcriptional LysR family regulator